MRPRRSVVAAVTFALAALACLATVQAGGAQAGAAAPAGPAPGLPITSEYQVIADTAHAHLFISQGSTSSNSILVTDLNGKPVTTIGGQDGVHGMTLSPDGSTLYAALSTGHAVSAISTATLRQTASYPLGTDTPSSVAVQSGMLWVGYLSGASPVGGIGSINPSSTGSFKSVVSLGAWVESAPEIAADPSGTGVLVTAHPGVDPETVASFNVSDPSAVTETASVSSTDFGRCGGTPDTLTVLPGGTTFLCGGVPYSSTTLAVQNSLQTAGDGPEAVARDGALAVSGLYVYAPGASTWTDAYGQWLGVSLPAPYTISSSSPVDFAWGADSQRLFTIVESTGNFAPVYQVLSLYPFQVKPASLTLANTATTVGYDKTVTVTPHLGMTYTNRSFSLYDTVAGSARQLLWNGTADGVQVSFGVSAPHNVTFTMVFAGDARYAPTTVKLTIGVGVKITAALAGYYKTTTISGTRYRVYHHTATLKDSVTVTPGKHYECVRLQVQEYGKGAWHPGVTTGCGILNKSSRVTIARKLSAAGRFRVRADFVPAKTDRANVSTSGSWLYYDVTK